MSIALDLSLVRYMYSYRKKPSIKEINYCCQVIVGVRNDPPYNYINDFKKVWN